MPYFVGDQIKLACNLTSGTNLTSSGTAFWMGQVQNVTVNDNEGIMEIRYAGTASRDVQIMTAGPQTYGGTIKYNVQDFRMLKYVLGSCTDAGAGPYLHTFVATNNNSSVPEVGGESLPAFNVEISKSVLVAASGVNFVQQIYGCFVDNFMLSAGEGTPVTASVDFIGRAGSFLSGTTTTVTADTNRCYLWSDMKMSFPASGTTATANIKSFDLSIANNHETPNYVDNTRIIGTPIPINRVIKFNATLNAESSQGKAFYEQYFKGGSSFNSLLVGTISAGSREVFITMSGCKITEFNTPYPSEAVQTFELVMTPTSITAVESGLTAKYNPA
jgi:hypothetical protein